jgi:HK97 family phage prohead protease
MQILTLTPPKTPPKMKKYNSEFEYRIIPGLEIRALVSEQNDQRIISGMGAVYDSVSRDFGGWSEVIQKGAFDETDLEDVLFTFNHNFDLLLGRSSVADSSVEHSEKGLRYSFPDPETATSADMIKLIDRGIVNGSSFMFRVKEDDWQEMPDGSWRRAIVDIDVVIEMGPVAKAAYPGTEEERSITKMMEQRGISIPPAPQVKTYSKYPDLIKLALKK